MFAPRVELAARAPEAEKLVEIGEVTSVFTNYRISVYGNPPQATRDRMLEHGFWPPAFEGEFRHFPYFMGFRD